MLHANIVRTAPLGFAFFVLATATFVQAAVAPEIPGHAVVARPEKHALVIWDATLEVAAIVAHDISGADANVRLERDALNVLAIELPKLADLESIEVRVVYTKTGAVSPVYGSPAFAGVERYATLSMSAAAAKSDKDGWREAAVGTGALPTSVKFTISGALPPR